MISWSTAQQLLIFLGPWLFSYGRSAYQSYKYRPVSAIKPLPRTTSVALGILLASAVLAFISTFPLFGPENVYLKTSSTLRTSADVLLNRLKALRPLTPRDEALRKVLANGAEAKLLYARFGPDILTDNPFASPGDLNGSQDYLYYAISSILTPHLLHLFALGVATSTQLCGREGARWRTPAVIAGFVLAAAEVWFIASYDDSKNSRSTRITEVDFVFWKLKVWRGLGIAFMDGILGWVIWLQATGRAFVVPPTTAERLAMQSDVLQSVLGRVRGVGILKNGVQRDAGMRMKVEDYWRKDGEVMRDIYEDPEVVRAQNSALAKLDLRQVHGEAARLVEGILQGVRLARP